jgi:phage-related baseplate assembly protein
LTDLVVVADPETVPYDITFTYYISRTTALSAADIEASVNAAVNEYVSWQCAKLGRDVNPSYLIGLLMKTGIKRVELTAPAHMPLRDGSDNTVPQVAQIGVITVTNGGYEDD